MNIRTKIVATVGPACGGVKVLRRLAEAGVDVFRINFSHGSGEHREEFLRNVRHVERELGEPLAVMADLCGPKVRVGPIVGGSMLLVAGQELAIVREAVEGDPRRISTTLAELVDEADAGQALLLDDGKIRLEVVESCAPRELRCRVIRGGVLSGGKGVNLPHTALKLSALTEKDRRDVDWIASREFDFVALSFVRSGGDVRQLRGLLDDRGCGAHIVAKIEKPQALDRIEEIVAAADAIMVARGDLGVEMDLPAVPAAQKRIARLCQRMGTPCIIATQMLETMTHAPTPTRAEVSDVANAVLDHADAVMLSGETAVGEYPVEAAAMMNRIVQEIQGHYDETTAPQPVVRPDCRTTAALARAVRELCAMEDIAAVGVYTATGTTARMLAKQRLPQVILAMSVDEAVVRRTCLYYGVISCLAPAPQHTGDVLALLEEFAKSVGVARAGQKLAVLSGRPIGRPGATNTLVVHEVRQ